MIGFVTNTVNNIHPTNKSNNNDNNKKIVEKCCLTHNNVIQKYIIYTIFTPFWFKYKMNIGQQKNCIAIKITKKIISQSKSN